MASNNNRSGFPSDRRNYTVDQTVNLMDMDTEDGGGGDGGISTTTRTRGGAGGGGRRTRAGGGDRSSVIRFSLNDIRRGSGLFFNARSREPDASGLSAITSSGTMLGFGGSSHGGSRGGGDLRDNSGLGSISSVDIFDDDNFMENFSDAEMRDFEEWIDTDNKRSSTKVNYQQIMTCVMAMFAVGLLVSGVVVGIRNNKNDDMENNISNNGDQDVVINKYNSSPRYVNFVTRIVEDGVTPEDAFLSENDIDDSDASADDIDDESSSLSPQQLALNWLVNDDLANLDYDHPALLDRYVLAVFYYSSSNSQKASKNQGGWNDSTNWMTGKGICDWYGIECVPREQKATVENDYVPYTKTYDDDAQITDIHLADNNIIMMEYGIPHEFGSGKTAVSELLTLDLKDNRIGSFLPKALGKLQKLRNLILKNNKLIGTLPDSFGSSGLKDLHELDLSSNENLHGTIPTSWKEMTELRHLSLSHNSFNGTIENDFFRNMNRMTGLHLEDNNFRGTIPSSLSTLSDLLDMRISQNEFHGSLTSLTTLENLETLHFNNNAFNGTLPDMFDSLYRLHELSMQGNELIGSVPYTLTHLQSLKTLNLAYNRFSGTIPPGLGLLTDVVSMSLQHNQFDGTIPTLLGKLDDITTLSLNDNLLTGTIPTELGPCFRLNHLHVESNKLSGDIPTTIGELTGLKSCKLESNRLGKQPGAAKMPPQVCALRDDGELSILTSDCRTLLDEDEDEGNGGQVICDCCTRCF